ncbi:IclR family transcriptional regulator [Salmonella enterica subsp. enterica]|uniref:IclR family transcriptional regulator n=1 Tax=Salmonella enterica I TaxID=59201 RepID=A0A3S4J9J8_SALET|nr:IclR family transcriptional regulator [Salmonella enterica subsp. enterica]
MGYYARKKTSIIWGLRLYELGNKAAEQYDIKKIALPILEEIRDNTGLTCHLGVSGGRCPYLSSESRKPTGYCDSKLGGASASHYIAPGLGKVLIAWLSGEELEELLPPDQILTRFTDTTITDVNILKQELAGIRRRGWGYDNEEDSLGVRCIAVPVFQYAGESDRRPERIRRYVPDPR